MQWWGSAHDTPKSNTLAHWVLVTVPGDDTRNKTLLAFSLPPGLCPSLFLQSKSQNSFSTKTSYRNCSVIIPKQATRLREVLFIPSVFPWRHSLRGSHTTLGKGRYSESQKNLAISGWAPTQSIMTCLYLVVCSRLCTPLHLSLNLLINITASFVSLDFICEDVYDHVKCWLNALLCFFSCSPVYYSFVPDPLMSKERGHISRVVALIYMCKTVVLVSIILASPLLAQNHTFLYISFLSGVWGGVL